MFIRDERNNLILLKNMKAGDIFTLTDNNIYYLKINTIRTDGLIDVVILGNGEKHLFNEDVQVNLVEGTFVIQNSEKIK